ncbi:tetraspanin-14-like isoform X2 [Ornithodoros turicata]|uniref:tetraspanin-14-like isoform X2 n=1 Tax=Ornithodoros turicata TaxID=34597 RepID=UPI0031389080
MGAGLKSTQGSKQVTSSGGRKTPTRKDDTPFRIDIDPFHRYLLLVLNSVFMSFGTVITAVSTIERLLNMHLIEYYRDNDKIRAVVDYLQTNFECCGVTSNGFRDWNQNMYFNCSQDNPSSERCSVPNSCCILADAEDIEAALKQKYCSIGVLAMGRKQAFSIVYSRNCVDAAIGVIRKNTLFLIAVTIVVEFALIIVRSMAQDVLLDLETSRKAYENYEKAVNKDHTKMANIEAAETPQESLLVDLGYSEDVSETPHFIQPCRTPRTPFDRAISREKIQHIARCRDERVKVFFSWDCKKHNGFNPNCEYCVRDKQRTSPGTPCPLHRGHHVVVDRR